MIRILSTAACLAVLSTSTFAAEASCSKADNASFKPQADLTTMLKKEGTEVKKIKTEGGCYEVYGVKAGKKVNLAFNAETLEPVKNPEAGEQ